MTPDHTWTPDGRRRIYGPVIEHDIPEFDIEQWEKKMQEDDE